MRWLTGIMADLDHRAIPRHTHPAGFPVILMAPNATCTFGFALLEAMIAVVLLSIGLVALAGLLAKTTVAQIESYQRTQALLLAQDMADRLLANKTHASSYVRDDYGVGPTAPCGGAPGYQLDSCRWGDAIRGTSEQSGSINVGTLLGGRGCITAPAADRYQVIVAWQGLVQTVPPSVSCGRDGYGIDTYRRAVVVPVHLANLAGA
jgi:type IV pilus assembly protein PilV